MKEIDIPRYVDNQFQLFFWEFDEAIIFIGCLAGGIALGGYFTLVSMALGYGAVKAFRRFKNGSLEGVLYHLCYWAGLLALNKQYQDSSKRDFFY
ncbi:type IV conjugative transfer system protein TraL (plasmid) [Cupriavidus metallidurans]|uniref:type IV conjugative transfer system protein TraL n=1 Tax=Cupriavidus metallidurans TaxID=119219 RepID=UPI003D73B9C5